MAHSAKVDNSTSLQLLPLGVFSVPVKIVRGMQETAAVSGPKIMAQGAPPLPRSACGRPRPRSGHQGWLWPFSFQGERMGAAQAGSPGSTHRGVPHRYCSASAGVLAGPSVTYCGRSEAKGVSVTSGSPVQSLLDLGPGHSHLVFSFQFFPSGNKPGPCWLGPSPRANGDPVAVAKAQPR